MITHLEIDLAAACAATYQAPQAPLFTGRDNRVHVYLSMIDGVHTFAHEGTTAWDGRTSLPEWFIDFDATPSESPGSAYGLVHQGIMLDVLSVVDQIEAYLAGLGWPEYDLCGHSKGAGEVTLEAAELKRRGHPPGSVRAFEPPQVGGLALRDYLSSIDYAWTATINKDGRDVVTRVPEGLQLPYFSDWSHINDPILLVVPDSYDLPAKHQITTVQEALARS